MSKEKIEIEKVLDLPTAIAHLENVLSGLRKGSLTLTQGLDSVTLNTPSVLAFELSASRRKEKQKLSIELSWKSGLEETPDSLRIG